MALLAFAEGYSRLYLGRHWIVDVLGGWVFGGLLLAVAGRGDPDPAPVRTPHPAASPRANPQGTRGGDA